MAVVARHVTGGDLAAIESLCEVESHILEKHWGPYSLPRLMERSAMSCVAVDSKGAVVGFACFHHVPSLGDFSPASWLDEVQSLWSCTYLDDLHPSTTLVLQMFFAEHLHDEQVLNEVIKMALVTFTEVERIMLFLPVKVPLFEPLIGNFEPLVLKETVDPDAVDVQALVALRSDFMGEMQVRTAVVEDHDDLVPIFKAQHHQAEELGEFFLAQMIQEQDDNNKTLVAEVNGRAVGLLSLTADAELETLQEVFELEPFDYLVKGYAEEALRVKESHVEREKRRREEHTEQIDRVKEEAKMQVEEEFEQFLTERQEMEEEEEGGEQDRTPEEEAEVKARKAAEDDAELLKLISEAQEDAVAEIGYFEESPEPSVDLNSLPVNAVCLTLFCLDPSLDCQVQKLLRPTMEMFPEHEYCLVLVPHQGRHVSLLRLMQPVREKLGQSFSHALYMIHRAALYTPMGVLVGSMDDAEDVAEFLEDESEPSVFLDTLRKTPATPIGVFEKGLGALRGEAPVSEQVMVARILGQVVAVVKVALAPTPGLFPNYYEVEELVDPSQYAADEHLEIKGLVVNPIFNNLVPDLILQAQRLTGTCCTYALLPPHLPIPDSLKCFPLVPVRRQQQPEFPADLDPAKTSLPPSIPMPAGPPCLVHTNYRLLCQRKRDVDARVLIIGGSDTAIAVVEELFSVPYLNFHHVTVLAPGGISTKPPQYTADALNFSELEMLRHLVHARALIIPGAMLSLDRAEKKVVALTDEGEELFLHYDHLILAPGLRDQLIDSLTAQQRNVVGVFSPQDTLQEAQLTEYVTAEVVPQEDVRVCIYGTGIDTMVAAQRLMTLGVHPQRLVVLCPGEKFEPVPLDRRANELIMQGAVDEGITFKYNATPASIEARQQRLTAVTLEDGTVMPCGLLLSLGEHKGVDPRLFLALNQQSLVLDGRLVVDAAFKTNDPSISAGGDLVNPKP
ncbi:hypothetical protein T484DRAFT_3150674 [Baffinella frigidus]|nr:hypothetical protein T484DRAFT_3150674 [Cryptophyta sp. CCMP2293]